FTAMRAEIALMSGSAFAVTHHAFSSGAGRTSDGNGSHASTLKSPSYTKSVSWQHYPKLATDLDYCRVDLMVENERVYFSEITLTPESGQLKFSHAEWDLRLGRLWNMPIMRID
ncbi:TPA: hypothetical protein L8Q78_005576, partial [Klebsiella pneumoniae]|nr:hypothetical protein [Klebsiella pneumoniae]